MDTLVLYWAAGFITVSGALGILWKLLKPVWVRLHQFMDGWDDFTRDWAGESSKPGRSQVPGVMERLNRIDGELKRNGGSSMKDAVARIEKKLDMIDARLETGNERFKKIEKKVGL